MAGAVLGGLHKPDLHNHHHNEHCRRHDDDRTRNEHDINEHNHIDDWPCPIDCPLYDDDDDGTVDNDRTDVLDLGTFDSAVHQYLDDFVAWEHNDVTNDDLRAAIRAVHDTAAAVLNHPDNDTEPVDDGALWRSLLAVLNNIVDDEYPRGAIAHLRAAFTPANRPVD